MYEIPNIIPERVDDLPLLLEQMQRMGLPTLFDPHFPTHGTWTGLSWGGVSTLWLSSLLSRGDHRLVHVAPWVAQRLWTLRGTTGQTVTRVDCTAARLASVLRRLSDATRWALFEAALHQHPGRVYDLSTARGPVDSPSARVYATVSAGGLFQCGHSQHARVALPQVQVMQAGVDPWGRPLATAGGAGERAAAPLYLPGIARVQARVGRHGLFYGGDGKRASRDPRARGAAAGDFSLCPRPQVPLAAGAFEAALAAVCKAAQGLSAVLRAGPQGQPEVLAEGYEYPVALSQQVGGQVESWTARRLVVRSVQQAHAAAAVLRARVAKALAQIAARKQRGHGQKRVATVAALRQAVVPMGQRYRVANLRWFRLTPPDTPHPVRAYRGPPARVDHDHQATVEVRVDDAAWEATLARLGGRVYGTNPPLASLSLAPAGLA